MIISMCFRPLHIKNPKLDFDMYRDPMSLGVPCGHCYECENAIKASWYTRLYYEYLDCRKNHNGVVLYVTLTFSQKNLPRYDGKPCFNKRLVQLFLKRFRKKLGVSDIKYFITSEFGGVTHRPHHHGIIFIPRFLNLYNSEWKKILRETWRYGFIQFGKKGPFVTNAGALNYVCKYISKDENFFSQFSDDVPNWCKPFHIQSKHLGEYIIEHFQLYDLSETTKKILSDNYISVESKDGCKLVFVPKYITRKICYNVRYEEKDGKKVPRWYINDFGKQVKHSRFNSEYKNLLVQFNSLKDSIPNIIYDPERLAMFNRVSNSHFTTALAIRLSLQNIDLEHLAKYTLCYKDMVFVSDFNKSVLDDIPLPVYGPASIEYMLDVKFGLRNPDFETSKNLSLQAYKDSFDFERALEIFNALRYVTGYYAQIKHDNELKENSERKKLEKLLT